MRPIVTLRLKVNPRSARDRIVGWMGGLLKVSVTAPPEEGRANEAVIGLLARSLRIPGSRIRLVSGEGSREKVVALEGVRDDEVFPKLPPRQTV